MSVPKVRAPKQPLPQSKKPDVDGLLARVPAGKRLPKARAAEVLGKLELVRDEPVSAALKRRGLKDG
jgi:hypothetical protein